MQITLKNCRHWKGKEKCCNREWRQKEFHSLCLSDCYCIVSCELHVRQTHECMCSQCYSHIPLNCRVVTLFLTAVAQQCILYSFILSLFFQSHRKEGHCAFLLQDIPFLHERVISSFSLSFSKRRARIEIQWSFSTLLLLLLLTRSLPFFSKEVFLPFFFATDWHFSSLPLLHFMVYFMTGSSPLSTLFLHVFAHCVGHWKVQRVNCSSLFLGRSERKVNRFPSCLESCCLCLNGHWIDTLGSLLFRRWQRRTCLVLASHSFWSTLSSSWDFGRLREKTSMSTRNWSLHPKTKSLLFLKNVICRRVKLKFHSWSSQFPSFRSLSCAMSLLSSFPEKQTVLLSLRHLIRLSYQSKDFCRRTLVIEEGIVLLYTSF